MRSIPAGVLSAQLGSIVAPRHALIARSDLLSFSAFANAAVSIDTLAPQAWAMRNNSNLAYVTFRTDWREWVRVIDTTVSGDWALSASGAAQIFGSNAVRTMRSGVFTDSGGSSWLYTATASGSAIQVQRAALSGTSNPLTVSLSNYGVTFGSQLTDTAALVRRVEAVCPTDGGVVVAVGTHRFDVQLTTIEFYWLPDTGSALMLNALLQMPLTESYSAWHAHQKNACAVQAIYNPTTKAVIVIANAAARGYGVLFTIKGGVESELRPVAPFDPASVSLSFLPTSLSKIGGLYYLAGRFGRVMYQNKIALQNTAFDCYLTSADGEDWSFGERNFFLQTGASMGALLMRNDTPSHVYYGGNGLAVRAPITPVQHASATTTTITDDVIGWSADCVTGGADALAATLANPQTAGGGDTYSNHAHIKRGGVVTLRTGQEGTLADFGVYGIDTLESSIDPSGQGDVSISARDYGSKRLIDTNMLVEAVLAGRVAFADLFSKLDFWDVKTPDADKRGLRASAANGLVYEGLNDPIIAHAITRAGVDGLFSATVRFNVTDAAHLSSLGFIFGAGDDGNGNVMLVPKTNTWTGHQQIKGRIRRMNLPAIDPDKPDKEDTGYNLLTRKWGVWEVAGTGTLMTAALSGGTLRTDNILAYTPGTDMDVRVRISGRRVQLFIRGRNLAPASAAASAHFGLFSEFIFGDADWRSYSDAPRVGLALCTDVPGSTAWTAWCKYGDIGAQLTDASTLPLSAYTRLAANGTFDGSTTVADDSVSFGSTPAAIQVGSTVRLYKAGYMDQLVTVAARTSNRIDCYDYRTTTPAGLRPQTDVDKAVAVYVVDATDDYMGAASSGARKDAVTGGMVWTETGAAKRPKPIWYRGAFVTDDTTALAIRLLTTDGNLHQLRSGSTYYPGGTYEGWDTPTYPTSAGARSWRLLAHAGRFFGGAASQFGMQSSGYLIIGDEKLRYAELPALNGYLKRGALPGDTAVYQTGVYCPAAYVPLAGTSGASTVLTNFKTYGGIIPGDRFDQLATALGTPAAGLLAEVVTRDGPAPAGDTNLYIASTAASDPPTATLTGAYPNPISGAMVNIDNPATPQADKDKAISGSLAIVSGRAQFGSKKESHDADTPAVYYPCDAAGNVANIQVRRMSYFAGRFQSVQDAIERLAALAGVREVAFRNAFTTPTADVTTAISTTPYTLPLAEGMSNFTLDMNVHLPGNSTNSGGYTNAKRLNIYFRDYYRLTVQLYNTAGDIAAGRLGNVRVALATTKSTAQGGVDADVNGDRWLEAIAVPVSDYNLSGSYSGSNPNYTLTEDATRNIDLRVAVHGALVTVEIGGQPVYTFNLDDLTDGTNSYRRDTAAIVQVEYSAAISGNSATIRVQELGDELETFVARRESSVASSLSEITDQRRIKSRATQNGGVEWSQFRVRDNLGAFTENLFSDRWSRSDTVQSGHLLVASGDVAGEALDTSHITTEGYRFGAASNDFLRTVEAAAMEARLLLRDAKELAETRGIAGVGFIQAQPEDRATLLYDPSGDAPSHASSDHVISGVRFNADATECTAEYTLRGYQAL